MAAISTVKVTINGTQYNLTYNSTSGKWEGTGTAPAVSSYNNTGHYFNATVVATDAAGNSKTVDASDATVGNSCKLVVHEKTAPSIQNITPASNALLTESTPQIIFDAVDSGSGVDETTISLRLDSGQSIAYNAAGMSHVSITSGFRFTYTPQTALSDGAHTISISANDHDGNTGTANSTFTTDTTAPSLDVTAPTDGIYTNQETVNVVGTSSDATSSVTVSIMLNGIDQGGVTLTDGAFSKAVTLTEGSNTIVVTATDAAGKSTSITRIITLSTTAPTITAVEIIPNPADAGATLTFKVTVVPG